MKLHKRKETLHELLRRYSLPLFMMLSFVSIGLFTANHAEALYVLTGTEDAAVVLDSTADEAAVRNLSSQLIYVGTKSSGFEITLKAGQIVTVHSDGATVTAPSQGETISALLSRLSIEPGPLDMVLVDISGQGTDLTVASDLTYYDQATESVAYKTIRKTTPDLPLGQEKVVQQGVNGTRTVTYEIVCSGGKVASRQFVEAADSTAVDEIVEVGTAVTTVSKTDRIADVTKTDDGGILTFRSGATMKYSAIRSMTATAYTAGYGGADHYTATGTRVQVGTVAVDRNVIPLGTRMYIVTNDGRVVYGVAVAADTGVRGNIIDLYYDTYSQCLNFGRRACTVYLLGK